MAIRVVFLLAAVVLAAAQAPATSVASATQPASAASAEHTAAVIPPVSPVHYVQPVYDNVYSPPSNAAVAWSDCAGGAGCGTQQSSGGLITPVYDNPPPQSSRTRTIITPSGKVKVVAANGQPAPATKKAKLDAEIVKIARFVDAIEVRLREIARAVDASASPHLTGVKANITIAKNRVRAEEARVNASLAKGQISQSRATKELTALRFIKKQVHKCEEAVAVISAAKKVPPAARKQVIKQTVAAVAPEVAAKDAAKKAAKQAKKAAKKAAKAAKKAAKAAVAKANKVPSLAKKILRQKKYKLGNITVALAARIDRIKKDLIRIAKRVDHNQTASAQTRILQAQIVEVKIQTDQEELRVRKALQRKTLTAKAAEREFRAITFIRKEIARCEEAARVILNDRKAVKKEVKLFKRAKGGKKKASKQLKRDSLANARKIDALKSELLAEAKRVDKNQHVSELTRASIRSIEEVSHNLAKERARLLKAKSQRKITAKGFAKEKTALKIMEKEVAKLRKAATVILTDRSTKKAANSTNPKKRVAAKLTTSAVKAAALIDQIKAELLKDAKKVDKGASKKTNAVFVASIRQKVQVVERMLAAERRSVDLDFKTKKISLRYYQKQLRVLNIMTKQLRRIRRAVSILARSK